MGARSLSSETGSEQLTALPKSDAAAAAGVEDEEGELEERVVDPMHRSILFSQ